MTTEAAQGVESVEPVERPKASPKPNTKPKPKLKSHWIVRGVVLGGLVPALFLAVAAIRQKLGADPIAFALNRTGSVALILLTTCLACTPIRILTDISLVMRVRKHFGLLAFFYVCVHFLIYSLLDQGGNIRAIWQDVIKHPFVLVGMGGLLVLTPLAVTSGVWAVKKLGGRRWQQLHRLAYLAGVLGVLHFYLRVKKDHTEPLIYGAILVAGLGLRLGEFWRKQARKAAA